MTRSFSFDFRFRSVNNTAIVTEYFLHVSVVPCFQCICMYDVVCCFSAHTTGIRCSWEWMPWLMWWQPNITQTRVIFWTLWVSSYITSDTLSTKYLTLYPRSISTQRYCWFLHFILVDVTVLSFTLGGLPKPGSPYGSRRDADCRRNPGLLDREWGCTG